MTASPQPAFRRVAEMISQDLVVVPLVESALRAGKFPEYFTVTFRDEGRERKPDGWFHPSTHPMWGERQLFYYLTRPDELVPEEIEYQNRMAMLMGTAVHAFIQVVMIAAGILIKPHGTCVACGREHGTKKNQCHEWGAIDRELGRRGHVDGLLEVSVWKWGRGLFEFKSIGDKATIGLQHHDVEWLKKKKPGYYAQVQDYLDMTGMQKAIIIFAILGFPWRLVEIEVPYDEAFMIGLRGKYRRVREAVAADEIPDPCCAPRSKESKVCPALEICPIARIR